MGARFKLTDHDVALAGPELALWKKVEPILKQEPLKPPVLHELAKKVNLPVAATDKLLGNCVKFGLVLKPVKNRFFLPEAINQLKQTAMNLADESDQGKFTVIEFRDRVGIGRNLCIEILEYFDRSGFTRRDADHRTIQDPSR